MSASFYKDIIEDEIRAFSIKNESLKFAAKSVAKSYSEKALKNGTTFLDYNIPSNRCAYLYKYAALHTSLVTKNFRKLLKKKEVKIALRKQKYIKICCLGGGPGIDVVGLFKALALFSHYHKRIVEVTILDICGGWRNSFKRIISNLISGKVKDVPETFVDASNFKYKLIEVNLLEKLPDNIISIISDADILCMVKFISAIIGSSSSLESLKFIGEKFKTNAITLFIDNFRGNVFKPLAEISGHIGLKMVLGPLHEIHNKKGGYKQCLVSSVDKKLFGCLPLGGTSISIIGFIKLNEPCINSYSDNIACTSIQNYNTVDDDGIFYVNESDNLSTNTILSRVQLQKVSDKMVQTDASYGSNSNDSYHTHEFGLLVDALSELVNSLTEWLKQRKNFDNCDHN